MKFYNPLKISITVLFLFLYTLTFAQQYNNTYIKVDEQVHGGCVLHTSYNETYLVINNNNALVKLDINGNVVLAKQGLYVDKMIEVDNQDIITISRKRLSEYSFGIVISRLNSALNVVWSRYLDIGYGFRGGYSMVKELNNANGYDIVLAYTATAKDPRYSNDGNIAVMKLNANDGSMLWNYLYYNVNRPLNSGLINDNVNSIIKYSTKSDPANLEYDSTAYVIAGHQTNDTASGDLFAFSINSQGNILNPYHSYRTVNTRQAIKPDLVWDGTTIGLTYEEDGSYSHSVTPSSIGLLQLNSSLVPVNACLYRIGWENYGRRITYYENIDDGIGGEYRVSSMVSSGESGGSTWKPANIMYIDKATLIPNVFYAYNFGRLGEYNDHFTDDIGHNYISFTPFESGTSQNIGARLIKTEITGDACGAKKLDIDYNFIRPRYIRNNYELLPLDGLVDYVYDMDDYKLDYTTCDVRDAYSYRGLDTAKNNYNINVYPTILNSNENLNIAVGKANSNAEIVISNMLGQETIRMMSKTGLITQILNEKLFNGINIVNVKLDGITSVYKVFVSR